MRRGFTLVETVVALALIMATLVGPVALVVRGIHVFTPSQDKLIALNLAQEGIELVRLVRDNNMACDFLNGEDPWAWDRDPAGGSMHGGMEADMQQPFLGVSCGGRTIAFPRLTSSCTRTLRLGTAGVDAGIYGYQSGNPTTFIRCITVRSPAMPPDTGSPPIPPRDQMDVISEVAWTEGGRTREITLQERLYRWE